jgi:hypothetical protein
VLTAPGQSTASIVRKSEKSTSFPDLLNLKSLPMRSKNGLTSEILAFASTPHPKVAVGGEPSLVKTYLNDPLGLEAAVPD